MSINSNKKKAEKRKKFEKEKNKRLYLTNKHELHPELIDRINKKRNGTYIQGVRFGEEQKKASEILLEFALYIIEDTTNKIEVELAVDYSIMAWNWAVMHEEDEDEKLDILSSEYSLTDIEIQLVSEQVAIKRSEFDEYKFIVKDYDVELSENLSIHLSVVVQQIAD